LLPFDEIVSGAKPVRFEAFVEAPGRRLKKGLRVILDDILRRETKTSKRGEDDLASKV